MVRLHLPTILDFRIRHSLSRFEVLLQTRTDEILPALTADLLTWRFPITCVCNIELRVVLRRRQRKRDGGPFPRIGMLHIRLVHVHVTVRVAGFCSISSVTPQP